MIRQFFAQSLFDGTDWQSDVLLSVNPEGRIVRVDIGVAGDSPQRLGGVVIPAIPNLHSHAFQRSMAGLAEYRTDPADNFWTWRELMFRIAGKIEPQQQFVIARQLYIEMLKAGHNSVCEFHYLHHDPQGRHYPDLAESSKALLAAARDVGIGITLLPVLYQQAGFEGEPLSDVQRRFFCSREDYLRLLADLGGSLAGHENARLGLAFHSLRAVGQQALGQVLDGVDRQRVAVVHIHIAEQVAEVTQCQAVLGQRPVAWLLDHFEVGDSWCLVHATHLDPDEVRRLACSGAVAGLCPTTEANLGDGLFPLRPYLDAGGSIGIGSDSHISISPIEELRWLEYGQRLQQRGRNVVADQVQAHCGTTLWQRVAQGGAQATGAPLGLIEPGYRADWLVLDAESPLLVGRERDQLLDSLIFSGNINPVKDVYVGGQRLVDTGHHALEDKAAREFAEVMAKLLADDPQQGRY